MAEPFQRELAQLEAGEWKAAENIFLSAQQAVGASLERGEMEKFVKLLEAQKQLKGLTEFSLYSREGVVTHSSDAGFLRKTLPPDLRAQLLGGVTTVQRMTNGALEIYRSQVVQPDCVRCHTHWREGSVGGVMAFRFSTESLTRSQAQSVTAVKAMRSKQILDGLGSAVIVMIVFVALAFVIVRFQIAAPLLRIIERLTTTSTQVAATSAIWPPPARLWREAPVSRRHPWKKQARRSRRSPP